MENNWINTGVSVRMTGSAKTFPKLEKGIYELKLDDDGFYLSIISEEYTFPYKVYGIENSLIERTLKTYENTTGNLGLLFNGVKGTGKSVTAKQLCNRFNLPVILITKKLNGTESYLNNINQDIVVFIDEYEKIYAPKKNTMESVSDTDMLSLMDGALVNESRRIFLFTTNTLKIDDNLTSRPGRVRYVVPFDDLSKEAVAEIMDDCLKDKSLKEALTKEISMLTLVTVDIVKAIIEEVNIHGDTLHDFISFFNVAVNTKAVRFYTKTTVGQERTWGDWEWPMAKFESLREGDSIDWNNRSIYLVAEHIDLENCTIKALRYNSRTEEYDMPYELFFEIKENKHASYASTLKI